MRHLNLIFGINSPFRREGATMNYIVGDGINCYI